ncbi:Rho GTPase [Pelomyxa schiedti]|nr:Rho GTPase [Pelomyxa schiedti]
MLKPKELGRLPLHKLLVIGDGEANKTDVLLAYVNKTGTGAASETVFTDRDATVDVDGTPVRLMLRDTSGTEEYPRLKEQNYVDTAVLLILFSVACPKSFESVSNVWHPDIKKFCPGAPYILVGTQTERRDDPAARVPTAAPPDGVISYEQGVAKAKEIDAVTYMECSALTQKGIKEVFDAAARCVMPTHGATTSQEPPHCAIF